MPGDELPDSVNRTPTHTACADAHRVSAHHTAQSDHFFHHANTRGSRLRFCASKTFCHPRVMSRSLPHLTLTTSTSSLSPTSPILQSFSPTHTSLLTHDPYIHCDGSRRRGGSSEIPSPIGFLSPKGSSSIPYSTGILRLNIKI